MVANKPSALTTRPTSGRNGQKIGGICLTLPAASLKQSGFDSGAPSMMTRRLLIIGAAVLMSMGLPAGAQQSPGPYVRWAELEVASGKTAGFGEAARDNAAATLQEPGVIAFHSAAEKGNPQRIRVLEIYKDETAYRDHLQTPHFQRFTQVAQT